MLCAMLLLAFPSLRLHAQYENNGTGQKNYEVRGTVVNSVTHEPIARALVTITEETSSSQLTDNQGRFEFPNVPTGRSVLQARRPGFFAPGSRGDVFLPIAVGSDIGDRTLTLEPAGSITGQITMPASDPGSNIRVQLMRRTIQEGRARWAIAGMKLTNSEGVFRFGNLQRGDYKLITASSLDPDIFSSQAPVRWGFPSASYPEEGNSDTTGFLRLTPGQQLNAPLAVTREPFYSVTIPVANQLPQGYSVQISDGRGRLNDVSTFYDSRQQQFRAYLPNGSFTVTIQSYMPSPGFASEPITVRNAPVQVQGLAILPIHPIPVTIRKEFTSANNDGPQMIEIENGKQVEISRDINLMLFSAAEEEFVGVNLRHEPGGDNSAWVLENVLPGKYWVQTYANQGYVASITAGGTDLARDPLVIGPGGTSAPIEIVLRNDMATMSVRLKNTSPSINASSPNDTPELHPDIQSPLGFLYLVPQFDTSSVVQQAVPLQQTTSLLNLRPGTYRVLALDRPFDLEYRNPKALEAYSGKGQTITLEPNGTANIDVDIVSAEEATP
jgi:Carboxypeptidase regulatory-like domain